MHPDEWVTLVVLFLPFVGALIAPLLQRVAKHNAAWFLALVPAFCFYHFTGFIGSISQGGVITGGYPWVEALNVDFSWLIDGLSLTFALLVSGIGVFIVLYAGGYLKGHPHQGRFFSFILLFMGSMQGLVVADSLLMLFVFWELTSITSFLLIGFDHGREASRRAALQALIVTGFGGLSLLAGLLLIWSITGANSLSALLEQGSALREAPLYLATLLLILGGAFTKSAQFPFHFWLPNAMEAPTPVSAYLHSATMVKAGIYLLMRLNPVMGDTQAWETILPIFGGATLLCGVLLGIRQTDLKLMLAYTTVASLGLLVMLTGFGSEAALQAAVIYLVAHALFKGALFMVAGIIDHETGTRDIRNLGGIGKAMPITLTAAILAAFSMGGLPPFAGFLAKEEIYAGLGFGSSWSLIFTLIAILGNALMFAIGFAVALKPFIGQPIETPKKPHEGPVLLWLGPIVLAMLGLLSALVSTFTHRIVSTPMASAIAGEPVTISISAVPHIGMPFLLSLLTVILGILVFLRLNERRTVMAALLDRPGWGPDVGFDQLVRGLIRISAIITGRYQNGRLEFYLTATLAILAVTLLLPMILLGELPAIPAFPDLRFYEWAVFLIALLGLGAVMWTRDRLTAAVSLGIQGFAVAMLFMLFGAADLSFTQFMVETLSVIILALVLTRLHLVPRDHRSIGQKMQDGTIAVLCGSGMGLLLLRITQVPFDGSLSKFYAQYSRVIAHGRNVVNVIIVDFRGLDTLGEISVVMITGLAILALIRIQTPKPSTTSGKSER